MPKKKNVKTEEAMVENVVEETVAENVEEVVEETVEEVAGEEKVTITGVVSNCVQLNVRKKPDKNSAVVCVLNQNEKVTIAEGEDGVDGWLEITTKDGKKGFCMKEYIKIK